MYIESKINPMSKIVTGKNPKLYRACETDYHTYA